MLYQQHCPIAVSWNPAEQKPGVFLPSELPVIATDEGLFGVYAENRESGTLDVVLLQQNFLFNLPERECLDITGRWLDWPLSKSMFSTIEGQLSGLETVPSAYTSPFAKWPCVTRSMVSDADDFQSIGRVRFKETDGWVVYPVVYFPDEDGMFAVLGEHETGLTLTKIDDQGLDEVPDHVVTDNVDTEYRWNLDKSASFMRNLWLAPDEAPPAPLSTEGGETAF